ncbi:DUF2079 domain-containing protein [Granulicoccus sp. GXG6511]|uniref:DUF2079 domain-containing protein n=1 Tax=Granulicoccus sp. GXG6511 TaxID=3381351 RepID=UPI003D7DA077
MTATSTRTEEADVPVGESRWARFRAGVRRQPRSAWVWSGLAFVAYSLFSTLQWRRFESPSYDLAIFTQILQRYARFEAPIATVKGADYNALGDHFHPLLALLTPFYAAFPSAFTLLILQALLVAVSVFFIAKTAHEHLGAAGGWLIGGTYAFSWGVQQAVAVQFHEVAMGAPILAISLWLMMRERWVPAAIWAGLLVFIKEDLGLTVFMIGLVLAWRSRRLVLGALLSLWGVVMFGLTVMVILPTLNAHGQYDHSRNISADQLGNPVRVIGEIVTSDQRMSTVLLLVMCTGLFLVRSNLGLLVLPTLGWRFVSTNHGHWGTTWHYSLMLMPIVHVAAVDGIIRLRRSDSAFLRAYARHGAVIIATFAVAISNQLPLFQLRDPVQWQTGPRQESARKVLEAVPGNTVVSTDISLMHYLLSDDRQVYFAGMPGNPVEDYLVVDKTAGGWSGPVDAAEYGRTLHPGTRWETVLDENGYQVARRLE